MDMKDRIKMVMDTMQMSQKIFADAIGISAGTLSSILSGHTKPTLQTVVLITRRFPEIDMKWLITGEGSMYLTGSAEVDSASVTKPQPSSPVSGVHAMPDLFSAEYMQEKPVAQIAPKIVEVPKTVQRRISEIRVFFDDGTYETFEAKK